MNQENINLGDQVIPRVVRVLEKGMWEYDRDPELEELLTPLDEDVYKRLEGILIREGCNETLYAWNGVIVDGHNRFKICWAHNIPFPVTELEFEDKGDVIIWMIERQLGRRNLSAFRRGEIAQKYEQMYAEKAKKRMMAGKKTCDPMSTLTEAQKRTTRHQIAQRAGVSDGTMRKIKALSERGDEETKKKLRRGDMTVNRAYNEMVDKESAEKTKVCECCGEEKPLTEFPRSRGGTYFKSVCKACEEARWSEDRSTAQPPKGEREFEGVARLEAPLEMPAMREELPRTPHAFLYVQDQVDFAVQNMLKELKIGLSWLRDEDKGRIPELLQSYKNACAQGEQMMKEMEVE